MQAKWTICQEDQVCACQLANREGGTQSPPQDGNGSTSLVPLGSGGVSIMSLLVFFPLSFCSLISRRFGSSLNPLNAMFSLLAGQRGELN